MMMMMMKIHFYVLGDFLPISCSLFDVWSFLFQNIFGFGRTLLSGDTLPGTADSGIYYPAIIVVVQCVKLKERVLL